jgi:hypothetical protein
MTTISDERLAKPYVKRNAPGHDGDGGEVVVPFETDAEMRRILSAIEASPAPVSEHPDDLAVDRFAAAMKAKLAKKREEGRCGWEDKDACSAEFLSKLLRDHVEKGDPLDVGNLAMMLHQRGDAIAPAPVSEEMVRNGARGIWDEGATGIPFEMAPTAVVDGLMEQSRAALTAALAAKGGQ